jgi:hypothetical protein
MDEMKPRARAYLRRYKSSIDPTPADVERQRRAVLDRVARGDEARPDAGARPASASSFDGPGRRPVVLAALGIAALFAIVFVGLRSYVDMRLEQAKGPSQAPYRSDGPEREVLQVVRPSAVEPSALVVPERAALTSVPAAPVMSVEAPRASIDRRDESTSLAKSSARQRGGRKASSTSRGSRARPVLSPPVIDVADLQAESAIVERARAALKAGNLRSARDELDRLARDYPEGLLVEERLALSASAHCRAGARARGRQVARELQRRFPGSLLAARVRDACASAEERE